jgi:glycerol-3-phosphate dehydrogenase
VKFDWLATQAEIAALEPNVVGNKALSFPSSGILDPIQLLLTLKNDAELAGATFLAGRKVIAMENRQREIFLKIAGNDGEETISCRYLINCAGLNADKLANLVNNENKWQLNPVRGEAACFSKTSRNNLLMAGLNVYPAPAVYDADTGEVLDVSLTEAKQLLKIGKAVKTVGVHLTPTFSLLDGKWQIGNMVTIGPEKNIVSNVTDLHTNLKSAEVFLQRVKPFFPELKIEDLTLHQAGIAASIRGEADFIIQKDRKCQNCIQLVGIDSPGLTSCLAIAEYVAELLEIEENLK